MTLYKEGGKANNERTVLSYESSERRDAAGAQFKTHISSPFLLVVKCSHNGQYSLQNSQTFEL